MSLARRLTRPPQPSAATPSVILVEPPAGSSARSAARTWCFWDEDPGEYDDLVTASWRHMRITNRNGASTTAPLPRAYKMIRSVDFLHHIGSALRDRTEVRWMEATVTSVRDVPGGAEASAVDVAGRSVRLTGRWVFDTRPPQELPAARTALLQHFRGWFVTTQAECFDPAVADLMDFRTEQPDQGLSFVYTLPISTRQALVEYTEFSAAPLSEATYDAALGHYVRRVRSLGPFAVTAVEQGVIPMTDGHFPRRVGRRVFRLGVAGGATRPSTGYAFAAIQRQVAAAAGALHAGRSPLPTMPHTARHRLMDAVMLRALATGRVGGAAFFEELFRRNPAERVVRFLDGASSLRDEWAIGLSTPVLPMLRTLAELPLLPRRKATTCS
ncbi:lycopene cyclase family protein [Actinacidiphila glaucinigra]|uniref:lycopene cyclase family protein n=1 Tax=Actinacidiphila glaucinigra TaxID=235986 RepID=UPI003F55895A